MVPKSHPKNETPVLPASQLQWLPAGNESAKARERGLSWMPAAAAACTSNCYGEQGLQQHTESRLHWQHMAKRVYR